MNRLVDEGHAYRAGDHSRCLAECTDLSYRRSMSRWLIHDLYAHIPECAGHLALSIAFAQFVAVKCDEDPFDQLQLEAQLRESSCAQEVMRWLIRLLQAGELRAVSRPIGGGPIAPLSRNHWHADDLVLRFLTSQYSRSEPFTDSAPNDAWIFVDERQYLELWDEHRKELSGPAQRPPAAGTSRQSQKRSMPVAAADNSLLGLAEVENLVGFRRSTIYKLMEQGTFPDQVKVGNRSLWRRKDIERWVENLGPPRTDNSDDVT